jgi:hypothetical protein
MAGGVGFGLMFLTTLSACVILSVYTLAYAGRCLRVVLQGTAAGLDEVPWPEEPFFDWLWDAFHIVALGALCLVPPGIAARSLRQVWLRDDPLLRLVLLALPTFWLLFPIMVLSALSGAHRWMVLRATIIGRLFRILPATVGFYLLTGFVVVVAVVPWYGVYSADYPMLLPVAAVLSAAAVLIYSRLLGRIGQMIAKLPSRLRRPRRRPVMVRRRGGKLKGLEVRDPWAVPNELIQEPPRAPGDKPRPAWSPPRPDEIEPYSIAMETAPTVSKPPLEKRKRRGQGAPQTPDEVEGYGLQPQQAKEPFPPTPPSIEVPNAPPQPRESLAAVPSLRTTDMPLPTHPLMSGVWSFPVYFYCRPHWFGLSFWLLIVGSLGVSLQSLVVQLPQ